MPDTADCTIRDTTECACACHRGRRFATCSIVGGCTDLHYAEQMLPPIRAGASTGNIGPCAYPGCRGANGDPRLTRNTICEPSRRHYRTILDRLTLHYILLRLTLPKPVPPPGERVMRIVAKVYGHPSEWASDACRSVADQLSEAHDALAEHLHHDGPPHPGHDEHRRVAISHHYLSMWFDRLCTMPGAADTAEALVDLDRDIRRGLGKTDPRRFLPVPCPRPDCGMLGLVRQIDLDNGEDTVTCHACGERIPSERYAWWTRQLLHDMTADPEDGARIDTPA